MAGVLCTPPPLRLFCLCVAEALWLVTMRLVDWLKLYRTESEQRETTLEAQAKHTKSATMNRREPRHSSEQNLG